jgi:hypothetical protein
MTYEIDLDKIKPANVKKSDKYSKQIYKFLKDNPRYRQVYNDKLKYDSDSKSYVKSDFNPDDVDLSRLYFGNPCINTTNEILGKCIRSLVGNSRDKYTTFCYLCNKESEFVNVTKEFFEKYIEVGRCIYDNHYWLQDEETRYTYIDPIHRKCNWCGKEQEEIEVSRTYTHKEWR